MSPLLNQGDISRLKYLIVWTCESQDTYTLPKPPPDVRLRIDFAETEEKVWKIVLDESSRNSVSERKIKEWGRSPTEFYRSPNFKVEVFSLSLARGFNDQAFMEKVTAAVDSRVNYLQKQEDFRTASLIKALEEKEYKTYLALKAKYEKSGSAG